MRGGDVQARGVADGACRVVRRDDGAFARIAGWRDALPEILALGTLLKERDGLLWGGWTYTQCSGPG